MIRAVFRRVSRAIHRKALERRVRDWGNRIEELDQQKRNHAGNLETALTEMNRAKRDLAELDIPLSRVTHAPGRTVIVLGEGREARSVNVAKGVRRPVEAQKA